MILAIDFDGVIHDFKNPVEGKVMGAPMPGAQEAMEELQEQGHTFIIHTVRGDSKYVMDWLDYYDIPYSEVTNVKPNADLYLDDKALRFTDWPKALKEIDGYPN